MDEPDDKDAGADANASTDVSAEASAEASKDADAAKTNNHRMKEKPHDAFLKIIIAYKAT